MGVDRWSTTFVRQDLQVFQDLHDPANPEKSCKSCLRLSLQYDLRDGVLARVRHRQVR